MSFKSVLGQLQPKRILTNALQNSSVAHAYLFYGQESIGKKKLAIAFAKALNCKETDPLDACDECASCLKIERRIHPDFFYIEPAKSTPTSREAVIKIEEIRELQKKLAYLPYEGKTKVVVIDSAELMNVQAANSFLKTLEEPPSSTVLILISSNPHRLLPTLISRCQGIQFHRLSLNDIREILKSQPQEERESLTESEFRVNRSQGSVDRALAEDLAEMEGLREQLLEVLKNVSFDRMDIVFGFAKAWARQTEQLQIVLNELLGLIRDLALYRSGCGQSDIQNANLSATMIPVAQSHSLKTWLDRFNAVRNTQIALSGNANAQLFLENMLIEFCEAA
ncbi:MAG: DNA polymerase III subunit delta' [Nitrospina sp.]|jgi:DNA polymerase III subunit delta'|nr:DNA polymerase III subunit delta' [Nitrospina sp.]MBT3876253.1 DNA polymerase III subunit delta' [Nitrospina sp.]MBT4047982.1 DNA polymerase III subunit delta' [Nitrospina sp.]MBT4555941.1 DNA polymerase III subunit delta' [Nitrospina sp.]MBT5348012.1 DNA polymerase III subunit delta' [Nitrospina sp.]